MARISSRLDAAGEFLGQFGEHSSIGSRKSRPLVDDCRSRPMDSIPVREIS